MTKKTDPLVDRDLNRGLVDLEKDRSAAFALKAAADLPKPLIDQVAAMDRVRFSGMDHLSAIDRLAHTLNPLKGMMDQLDRISDPLRGLTKHFDALNQFAIPRSTFDTLRAIDTSLGPISRQFEAMARPPWVDAIELHASRYDKLMRSITPSFDRVVPLNFGAQMEPTLKALQNLTMLGGPTLGVLGFSPDANELGIASWQDDASEVKLGVFHPRLVDQPPRGSYRLPEEARVSCLCCHEPMPDMTFNLTLRDGLEDKRHLIPLCSRCLLTLSREGGADSIYELLQPFMDDNRSTTELFLVSNNPAPETSAPKGQLSVVIDDGED